MKLICYKKCTTCKSVEKMLEEKGINYEYRDIKEENPTAEEIKDWHEKTGLDIKRLFNTSGKIYRENNIKDKLKSNRFNILFIILFIYQKIFYLIFLTFLIF